jgi:hypothetical protein
VTNNNGFWIGWLCLLTPSCTISLNHNQLQHLKINDCLSPFLFSFSDWLLIYDWTTYMVMRRIHRKHIRWPAIEICEPHGKHLFFYCYIYSALQRNESYPIVARVFVVSYCCRFYLATGWLPRICLSANVFTASLPNNGSTCRNIVVWCSVYLNFIYLYIQEYIHKEPGFQRNLLPPSSTLQLAPSASRMMVHIYHTIRRHFSEYHNLVSWRSFVSDTISLDSTNKQYIFFFFFTGTTFLRGSWPPLWFP